MKKSKVLLIVSVIVLTGCDYSRESSISSNNSSGESSKVSSLAISMKKWNYDSSNDIYYQIGLPYCLLPESSTLETCGIYIPGGYFTGSKNSDGTYTCSLNTSGKVGKYSASTAPIVIPINTPGYSEMKAPATYLASTVSNFTKDGIIYLFAGCRGKSNKASGGIGGAPWGVTDLKAAIRYYRYNGSSLPGKDVYSFGMSGGGAQSAVLGASGDSTLYSPYLEAIGAASKDASGVSISDAIAGSMCWCPITNLDVADEAYEWNMGQFASSSTRASGIWTKALSDDLATSYASILNNLSLKDSNGNLLKLEASSSGLYCSGTYYDYILGLISESVNNYLSDNTSYSTSISSSSGSSRAIGASSTTYTDKAAFITAIDGGDGWVSYDSTTEKATVTSLAGFVKKYKNANKDCTSFDAVTKNQPENDTFGDKTCDYRHFDYNLYDILNNNNTEYSAYSDYSDYRSSFAEDFNSKDSLNVSLKQRTNMYNPMYYLCKAYDGYDSTKIASHWRIRTGICQGDTSLCTEANLSLALANNSNVKDVDFATVWNLAHTKAERVGSDETNFISWLENIA
jgi:hypothetical protein